MNRPGAETGGQPRNGRGQPGSRSGSGQPGSGSEPAAASAAHAGWRSARPELIIAAILVVVLSAAAFAAFGPGGMALTLVIAAVAALIALRALAQPDDPVPPPDEPRTTAGTGSFTGFFRKRGELADGTASMSAYDAQLRVTLQRLLAARLSERHGISLYQDPGSARQLLCPGGRDAGLWFWVDPARAPVQDDGSRSGIPPRTLATLIDRLERL